MQVIKCVFQPHGDDQSQRIAMEEFKDILFRIKQVYYMYDMADDYKHYGIQKGNNSRLNELQAAFLFVKLPSLDRMNIDWRRIADRYLNEIKIPKVVLPKAVLRTASMGEGKSVQAVET